MLDLKQLKYFIGLGTTISALYLCREESIWIFPFIIIATIITIISIIKDLNIKNKKRLNTRFKRFVELLSRFELLTSSLPRMRSTN